MMQAVSQEDITDILQLFRDSEFARLELSVGSFRVAVDKLSSAVDTCSADPRQDTAQVVAPLLGFFQASPGTGAPAFVRPGAKVEMDTTVGIIRVMQNLTTVKAGLRGTILDVLVEDGQLVEFDQPLVRVAMDAAAPAADRERAR